MVDAMGITLFLGSGASASVGLPTTNVLMNTLISRHQDDTHSFLEEYKSSDIEVLDDDMRKIEQSQNRIVNHLRVQYDSDFLKTIPKLRQEIHNCLFTELQLNSARELMYKSILDKLTDAMFRNGSKANIITTNYDMLVEKACALSNVVVADGFQKNAASMSAVWDNYWPDDSGATLVKLHGSINWHVVDDKITKESIPSTPDPKSDILIAPTLELKKYDSKPFDDLWKRFRHVLQNTSLLVVIGFSFRDKKLVNMIKEFIGLGLTVLSVSPVATKDVRAKFEDYATLTYEGEVILASQNNYSPVYTFDYPLGITELPSIISALDYVVNAIRKHDPDISYAEI